MLEGAALSQNDKSEAINFLLRDQEPAIRMCAAFLSTSLGNATTTKMLYGMLETETDADVERVVLASLGQLAGTSLIPILLNRLESEDTRRRKDALMIAANIPDERTDDAIIKVLMQDVDPHLRFLAAIALARRGRTEGLDVLLTHIGTVSDVENAIAASTLCMLDERAGFAELSSILAKADSLTSSDRSILANMLRENLATTAEDVESVLAAAREWVASKLAEG
jgi:HEAT repeat protein